MVMERRQAKKTLLGVLIAITFLSGIFVGGCGNDIENVTVENSEQTEQYQHAEIELVKMEEVLWLNYADAQLSFEADFPEVMP